jgi:hypothetical protein
VTIEAEGHGIYPHEDKKPAGNYIKYQVYALVDLNYYEDWTNVKMSLKGVDLPEDQYDSVLSGSPSGRMVNKKGDIWKRPDRVFKSAKLKGFLK